MTGPDRPPSRDASTTRETSHGDTDRTGRLRSLGDALREFAFGMTGYEFARHAIEARATLENLFLLGVVGDMIGVPILPPYYSLRLVPYVVPDIARWKRRVLREREFSDSHEAHLHGV